jgi:hypothetical protein
MPEKKIRLSRDMQTEIVSLSEENEVTEAEMIRTLLRYALDRAGTKTGRKAIRRGLAEPEENDSNPCPSCGERVIDGNSEFCKSCGKKLPADYQPHEEEPEKA